MEKIAGVAELALMLDVSRQRAWKITTAADFPAPCYDYLKAGDFWRLADIEEWARRKGRTLRRVI